jgi:putative ATP-binding cassette transporter
MNESNDTKQSKKEFIRNAWRLIYPYWLSREWKIAWILLVTIVSLNLGIVYVTVLINTWYNAFYNSLQQKNFNDFKSLIIEFCYLAGIYIVAAVYRLYLQQMLTIKWRSWLTDNFLTIWLTQKRFYSLELFKFGTDNPDQRIAEDLRSLSGGTLSLALGFLSSVTTLISFFMILWNLSGPIELNLFNTSVVIPGYMVWAAFLYAFFGSILTHVIGKKLIVLNFNQQKNEANFRYSLVRTREYADAIALAEGGSKELSNLKISFSSILNNWWMIMRYQKRLTWFTSAYGQAAVIFPLVVAAPRYFSGAIELGALMQISSAFGRVQDALSWFIDSYTGLTEWKASLDRLLGFQRAANIADELQNKKDLTITRSDTIEGVLSLSLPDGRILKDKLNLKINPKEHTFISGRSGSGKSTLFRVFAGLWPFTSGKIQLPESDTSLFFPQKPYLPIGTLRSACFYPKDEDSSFDDDIVGYFRELNLPLTKNDLEQSKDWSKHLSLGEQQRIVLIRAVILKPNWLYLDEAMASLDIQSEQAARLFLQKYLPHVSIVEIAHHSNIEQINTINF